MTAPQSESDKLLDALQGMSRDTRDQTKEIRSLSQAVAAESEARNRKVKAIQRNSMFIAFGIMILLAVAVLNLVNTTRTNAIAEDANQTNELLLGCLTPGNECSEFNARQQANVLNLVRQTNFVVAFCQRTNPIDNDPDGSGLVACIQSYYPDFQLPSKASPSPSESD